MPSISMSGGGAAISRIPFVSAFGQFLSGTVPVVLVAGLAFMNVVVLFVGNAGDDERTLWEGPLMPTKLFPLPDPSTAKIIGLNKAARAVPKDEDQPKKLVIEEKEAPKKELEKVVMPAVRYVVQVGQLTNEAGIKPLVDSLRSKGYAPKVRVLQQKTHMNNVQAGPYKLLEQAREAEAKLRAIGMDVWIDTSDQGYIISLTKTLMLAPALQDMKRFAAMTIDPLRLVKVEKYEPVHSVFMGPFNSKRKAYEVEERMARVDLVVPKIMEWKEED